MAIHTVSVELAPGRTVTIETGKLAGLAGGSVVVTQGETSVLVAACHSDARPGMDFFPLQVDYREKFSAAGRMPGGFFKREGRPSEKEILTARMTDRPLRPLFPEGYIDEVQVCALLLSTDTENEADVLSMLGSSAALMISDIPFGGPVAACRVGRVNGEFIANPTHSEMEQSDLDLVYSGMEDKTIMIEGGCDELTEEELTDALRFANEIVKKLIAAQRELISFTSKPKYTPKSLLLDDEDILAAVIAEAGDKLDPICEIDTKQGRQDALDAIRDEALEKLTAQFVSEERDEDHVKGQIKQCFSTAFKKQMRNRVLKEGKRMDGRGLTDVRPLSAEVSVLPRVHGSALFSRGETQGLVLTTLASAKETQDFDGITGGPTSKSFMLHYNFPNYSVGECGRIMGPGRREIGHGALAERSIARMMPTAEEYPYVVRCVSEIMSSNGSTSMASICAGSLALMDAGVPLKKAVAGISCGLIEAEDSDEYVMITDIIGAEDHYGDMDFKVAGTRDGITGFQLDLKTPGISIDMMYEAMMRDKEARMQILDVMDAAIDKPREEISPYAPRIHKIMINPEKIGALIGPGGSVIREITSTHDVEINIEDDGSVMIYANDSDKLNGALDAISGIVAEIEIGKIYRGKVVSIKDFGAFVEVLPGQDGLLHISEMADYRVKKVEDIVQVGDKVTVKCIDIDDRGRVRLSRRAALEEME